MLAIVLAMAMAALGGSVGLVGVASAGNTVSGCTTISSSGSYTLSGDLSPGLPASPCIEITASDVTFDGQGHTIDGSSGTEAISIDGSGLSNVTVRHVTITDWARAITINAADSRIEGVSFDAIDGGQAINPQVGADRTVVVDSTFRNSADDNTYAIDGDATALEVRNNTATDWSRGVQGSGDDVVVRDNDFQVNESGVNLQGDGVLVADNTFHARINSGFSMVQVRGSNSQITGNDIDNASTGIRLADATDVTIDRNDITDSKYFAVNIIQSNARVERVTVSDNDIDTNGYNQYSGPYPAIEVDAANDSTFANNVINGSAYAALNLTKAEDNTVADNTITNNEQSGIRLHRADGTTLNGNDVLGNNQAGSSSAAGVSVTNSTDVTVRDQVVRNNARAGLRIRYADRIEVRDSRITENCGGQFGVSLADSADALFVGNNVSNNTGIGMQVFDVSPNLTVRDSQFDDNGGYGGFQDEPGTTLENVTANGNAGYGISLSSDGVHEDVTARNNGDEGLVLEDNVTIDGGSVGGNGATYEIVAPGTFTATDFTVENAHLDAVEANAVDIDGPDPVFPTSSTPQDRDYVGTNVSVMTYTGGYFDVEVSYSDAEMSTFDVSTLELWRDTGGTWSDVTGTLDESTNTVSGNTTSGGTLAVLAAGNDPPTAAFTAPSSPAPGQAVSFDASGSSDPDGSIVSYDWDFGDGTTASGANPSHTFDSAGDYSVEVTVTDDAGATAKTTETVSVGSDGSGGVSSGGGSSGGGGSAIDLSGQFEVDATVADRTIEPGETLSVSATVHNTGPVSDEFDIELFLDGDAIGESQSIDLQSGDEAEVTLEHAISEAGEYDVGVADKNVGTVTVRAADDGSTATPDSDATSTSTTESIGSTGTTTDESSGGTGPGFGVLAAVVGLVAGALYLRRQ